MLSDFGDNGQGGVFLWHEGKEAAVLLEGKVLIILAKEIKAYPVVEIVRCKIVCYGNKFSAHRVGTELIGFLVFFAGGWFVSFADTVVKVGVDEVDAVAIGGIDIVVWRAGDLVYALCGSNVYIYIAFF